MPPGASLTATPKSAATDRQRLLDQVEALVSEAEAAFAKQPKALWSTRTYLAPKDAAVLRRLLSTL